MLRESEMMLTLENEIVQNVFVYAAYYFCLT